VLNWFYGDQELFQYLACVANVCDSSTPEILKLTTDQMMGRLQVLVRKQGEYEEYSVRSLSTAHAPSDEAGTGFAERIQQWQDDLAKMNGASDAS
jgi:hypothetical protein